MVFPAFRAAGRAPQDRHQVRPPSIVWLVHATAEHAIDRADMRFSDLDLYGASIDKTKRDA